MRAMTVLGPVDVAALGVVSPHEHLLIDLTYRWAAPPGDPALQKIAESPLTMDVLGVARRNMGLIRDNLVLDDEAMAADGLRDFKAAGGGTVVDCSQDGIGRDVEALKRISQAAGVHVVAPCGAYLASSHPAYVRESSAEQLAAIFVRELTVGVGETGIRAGWIGELGVGQPMYGSFLDAPSTGEDAMSPDEEKVLEAAGRAQAETGAPISVHIWNWRPNRLGLMSLDAIERGGGDPTKVVICHLDINPDLDTALRVVERGAYAELDTFGLEVYNDTQGTRYPRDEERIALAAGLIERGHLERVLIAQDVCTKTQTTQFGGWGYGHIGKHVEAWMKRAGITDAQLRTLRVENPGRLLAYLP